VGAAFWRHVPAGPPGTVWIPGGEFTMGSSELDALATERPAHRVRVSGFWMDAHEVTNAEFARFVAATGYVTTAQKKPDWEEMKKQVPPGTPRPDDSALVAGALVFTPPSGPVPLDDIGQWWRYVPGADWRHPEGPGSSIDGRDDYPVVNVCWDDACAYARWAGKRLPTEAEWELAARGGLEGNRFAWGDQAPPARLAPGQHGLANIWQGEFPHRNTQEDGYTLAAPVMSYPPNGYGLYDMAGNVWEWCADWYRVDEYRRRASDVALENPLGPTESFDPLDPYAPKRVIRGGSFLCHITYCESYRTAARRGGSPDTGSCHTGFRCVVSPSDIRPALESKSALDRPASR